MRLGFRSFAEAARRTAGLWGALAVGLILWAVARSCPCVSLDAVPLLSIALAGVKLTGHLVLTVVIEILVLFIALAAWGLVKSAVSPVRDVEVTVPTQAEAFALDLSARARSAYGNPNDRPFRYVERFWIEGGMFGVVDRQAAEDTTYVVFRGTSEVGNWFLTNAQAHMWKASSVFGDGVPGGVHSGFAKGYFDLWRADADPPGSRAESYDATKYFWPIYMAVLTSPGWVWRSFRPVDLQPLAWTCVCACVVLTLLAIQFVFSHGHFENSFVRARELSLGTALRDTVLRHPSRRVVFVGHSLGGALATLAFVDFCTRSPWSPAREVHLVTFGAPQPGNDEFITWLAERRVPGQSVSVFANLGDPVAHLPPARSFPHDALRRVTLLGALLAAVYYIGWLPYAVCYQVSLNDRWSQLVRWRGRDEGLALSQHSEY